MKLQCSVAVILCTEPGEQIHMMPFKNRPPQHWRLVGNRIMKNGQECLDISQANKSDGAEVISYQYSGAVNQHWHLEYA